MSRLIVTLPIYRFSYQALYSYIPQNDDELELRDGDIVDVMEKCDDGWFVGKSSCHAFLTSGINRRNNWEWWVMERAVFSAQKEGPSQFLYHCEECWGPPVYVGSQGSVDDTDIEPQNQICQHLLHGRAAASFIHWVLFVFLSCNSVLHLAFIFKKMSCDFSHKLFLNSTT